MRLKVIERTGTVAWSPFPYFNSSPTSGKNDDDGLGMGSAPIADRSPKSLIAVGSVAGAMDASFSSTTELEVYSLDFSAASVGRKAGINRVAVTTAPTR